MVVGAGLYMYDVS